ncbi:MAG: hypothetical protein C1942_03960 [Prosthecochloris sp.]|uniref:ComEC/Rec2 family competence protein n=1 Tax=Prosthecochloris sp. TaxID=290513 RepID=UPI0013CA9D02|nr:ComEC/Rec2 family competence protein [Prosthecochloris sp.]NEX11842.1 hypothetical protein [Prosthecochloris sp.]
MSFSPAQYPSLRLLLAACSGILAGVGLSVTISFWLISAAVSALLIVVFSYGIERRSVGKSFPGPVTILCFLALVVSAFAAWGTYRYNYVDSDSVLRYLDREVLLHGTVSDRPGKSGSGERFIIDVHEVFVDDATVSASGRVSVFVRSSMPEEDHLTQPGDSVWLKGTLKLIDEAANAGDFDAREYYRRLSVHSSVFVAGPWLVQNEGVGKGVPFDSYVVRPVRHFLEDALDTLFPSGHERDFFRGLLLGERSMIDPEVYDQFRRTGTAHVLAISGLHVGLLVLVVLLFLQRFRQSMSGKWLVVIVLAFLLLIYSQVTGNAPSVRRASIMTGVLLGGYAAGRQVYPLNSLAFADLLMLAFDPLELYQAGFLMTNAAVAAILLLYPLLSAPALSWQGSVGRACRAIWNPFCISLSAMAGVSPLIALYFGSFSVAGIVANLPVVFLVTAMVFSLLPALFLHLLNLPLAELYASSAWFFAHTALSVTGFFSSLEWAALPVRTDPVMVVIYYLSIVALLYFFYEKKNAGLIITLLSLANFICWYPLLHAMQASERLIPVRTGRYIALLYASQASTVLIDAGSGPEDLPIIERQMRRSGIASIDVALQLSSPDTLVVRVDAETFMLSDRQKLVLPSMLVARGGKDLLSIWSGDGSSLLVAAGVEALMRRAGGHPERSVVVLLRRFGIDEYRKLAAWLDRYEPTECRIVCASRMPQKQRALVEHLALRGSAVSVE